MISFKITAPGKVILFGEHAVVYGKTAVAASLDRRSSLKLVELPPQAESAGLLHLDMPSISLSKTIPLDQLQACLLDPSFPNLANDGHDQFLRRIRHFVETTIGFDGPRQKSSLECLIYALAQSGQADALRLAPCKLQVDTELSIGAGVGSSASFSVCLAAGFLRWAQLQKDPAAAAEFGTVALESISRHAFNCERIMHGAPSGIDNSICTFGSIIEFRKGEPPTFIPSSLRSLRILLVDTGVGRSTKLLVDRLAGLTVEYPEIFQRVIEAIGEVSKRVVGIVKRMSGLSEDDGDAVLEAYRELSVSFDEICCFSE